MKLQMILALTIFSVINTLEPQPKIQKSGKTLFEKHCSACHGKTGTKGFLGAKNLQISKLDDHALFQIISSGKRIMPSWKKRLAESEINLVADYIKTLRK